jgi:DNA-binding protein HU-beta
MSKSVLAEAIRKATGCNATQSKNAVDEVRGTIVKALKKDGKFGLVGFGTFHVTKRGQRKGRNPRTGEVVNIKASKSVRFKASPTVKKRV